MYVQVNISLSSGETTVGSAQDIATAILTAVGGNPEKDIVNVQITDTGMAGQVAPASATSVLASFEQPTES